MLMLIMGISMKHIYYWDDDYEGFNEMGSYSFANECLHVILIKINTDLNYNSSIKIIHSLTHVDPVYRYKLYQNILYLRYCTSRVFRSR